MPENLRLSMISALSSEHKQEVKLDTRCPKESLEQAISGFQVRVLVDFFFPESSVNCFWTTKQEDGFHSYKQKALSDLARM